MYLAVRRVVYRVVALPDSGTVFSEITLPPALFTGSARAGWQALEVRLEGVAGDSEPRDDARVFVLEVSPPPSVVLRSEEHTSELQSRQYLVCRLLLEKKKMVMQT